MRSLRKSVLLRESRARRILFLRQGRRFLWPSGQPCEVDSSVRLNLHHTPHIYHLVRVVARSPADVRVGTLVGQVSLHREVLEMAVGRVGQDRSQREVVVVFAVADAYIDPGKGCAGERECHAAGWRENPVFSSVLFPGSTCP